MSAIDFGTYNGQHTERAPGASDLQCEAGQCEDCGRALWYGDGRYHHREAPERGCFLIGPEAHSGRSLSPQPAPIRSETVMRAAARYHTETKGCEYLIRRLPNWRLTHWALRRVNRYLRESGSCWKLITRNRDPRPGTKYGPYSKLADADARSVSVYLRRRTRQVWR